MSNPVVVRAYIKGIDQAPRKVSIVASLVRGRAVADAQIILDHTPRRSALAAGPRMRRFKPASRGRALPFEKKSSHILVEVTGVEKPKKKPAAKKPAAETKETVKESK